MANYLAGIVTGLIIFGMALSFIPASKVAIYTAAMDKCEVSLPRDQKCEIVAVIKQKEIQE